MVTIDDDGERTNNVGESNSNMHVGISTIRQSEYESRVTVLQRKNESTADDHNVDDIRDEDSVNRLGDDVWCC